MSELRTFAEIQQEIAALPSLAVEQGEVGPGTVTPLTILSKQGRVLLRLSAALETLEGRTRELSAQVQTGQRERERLAEELYKEQERQRQFGQELAESRYKSAAEIIYLLDTLEWVIGVLRAQNHPRTGDVESARRESARRLAALGITQIPAEGEMDGRLHEGLDTVPSRTVPPYHIVSVVRAGWQWGDTILRRAEVVTATPQEDDSSGEEVRVDTTEQGYEREERGKERASGSNAGPHKSRRRRRQSNEEQ